MNILKKLVLVCGILAILTVFVLKSAVVNATAQLFYSSPQLKTSAYSTSTQQMVYSMPGTATTTFVVNSDMAGPGNALDSATILVRMMATTTGSPSIGIRVQDSRDGIDYYDRSSVITSAATTTIISGGGSFINMAFASSSAIQSVTGTTTTVTQSINVPTINTRFTRFILFTPIGGGTYSYYSEVVPKGQQTR